jgi:hypothetical protein
MLPASEFSHSKKMPLFHHITTILAILCFSMAGLSWWKTAEISIVAASPAAPTIRSGKIEEIRLGQRVVGHNPLTEQVQPVSEIDPSTWKVIKLTSIDEPLPHFYEFIRSPEWLTTNHVELGGIIELDMFELGVEFMRMEVTAIESCPAIEADDGTGRHVVTGLMRHEAGNVLYLTIEGEHKPIGTTDLHPFWSTDRNEFVKAGDLKIGEHVEQLDGTVAQIVAITPHRGPPVMVYNLEVDSHHVYRVGDGGLLVHNSCFNKGGSFAEVSKLKIAGEVAHHTPQNAAGIVSRQRGPAIGMTIEDHELTRTFAGRGRVTNSADASLSPMERLVLDIQDIRTLFESKYDEGIRQMLLYASTLPEFKYP